MKKLRTYLLLVICVSSLGCQKEELQEVIQPKLELKNKILKEEELKTIKKNLINIKS